MTMYTMDDRAVHIITVDLRLAPTSASLTSVHAGRRSTPKVFMDCHVKRQRLVSETQ